MENSNITVDVNILKKKSNAPWIFGVIGLVLTVPSVVCTFLCAAGSAMAESLANEGKKDPSFATWIADNFWFIILASIVAFVALFFGKSKEKIAKITGIAAIVCASYVFLCGIVTLNVFGSAAAACFLIGGVFSIINSKRVA